MVVRPRAPTPSAARQDVRVMKQTIERRGDVGGIARHTTGGGTRRPSRPECYRPTLGWTYIASSWPPWTSSGSGLTLCT